jgi:hypothetical protein
MRLGYETRGGSLLSRASPYKASHECSTIIRSLMKLLDSPSFSTIRLLVQARGLVFLFVSLPDGSITRARPGITRVQ